MQLSADVEILKLHRACLTGDRSCDGESVPFALGGVLCKFQLRQCGQQRVGMLPKSRGWNCATNHPSHEKHQRLLSQV